MIARAMTRGAHRPGLVTFVVPAKNEAPAIARTLRALPVRTLQAAGVRSEGLILDGNSHDGTREIAEGLGATVVPDREAGKGAAVRNARAQFRGDYVVMLDADGTYAPDAIPRLLAPLAWGEADVVMGTRDIQSGAMSNLNRVGNALLSLGASVLYGRPCPDLCTGLWGFQAAALNALPLTSRGFELEAEIFSLASRLGLRIASVPVDYLPRHGITKLSAARDGLRIGWCLVRSRFVPLTRGVGAAGSAQPDAIALRVGP